MNIKRKTINTEAKKEKQSVQALYSCRIDKTPRKVMYIDDTGQINKDNFSFTEENPSGKKKEDILEKKYNNM